MNDWHLIQLIQLSKQRWAVLEVQYMGQALENVEEVNVTYPAASDKAFCFISAYFGSVVRLQVP